MDDAVHVQVGKATEELKGEPPLLDRLQIALAVPEAQSARNGLEQCSMRARLYKRVSGQSNIQYARISSGREDCWASWHAPDP